MTIERAQLGVGATRLRAALQNTARAALSRVFAGVHLEQISTGASGDDGVGEYSADASTSGAVHRTEGNVAASVLGNRTGLTRRISIGANRAISAHINAKTGVLGSGSGGGSGSISGSGGLSVLGGSLDWLSSTEGAHREKICAEVQSEVAAAARAWGVDVFLLQIGTTRLKDAQFAAQYEAASLEVAKVRARGRGMKRDGLVCDCVRVRVCEFVWMSTQTANLRGERD